MTDFVILAAGKGTRLWPITNGRQKCMLPVLNKPLLEWTISMVYPLANKIILVVGEGKQSVIEHFAKTPFVDKIVYAEQKEQKGTGHAVLTAEPFVDEDFTILNGDDAYSQEIFDLYKEQKNWFAIAKFVEDRSIWGAYKTYENGNILDVVEKQPGLGPGMININFLHVPKEFFNYLHDLKPSPRGELELTDGQKAFALENELKAVRADGYWNGLGYFWSYIDVNRWALEYLMEESIEGNVEAGAKIKGKLSLGRGAVIKSGTVIEGNAFIGENTVIGPNAYLRGGVVIGASCHIGSSEVKASVIMDGTNAAHHSYIGDSVVCENVNLGAGTKVANLRFDEKNVHVKLNEKMIDSCRKKLGSAIGPGTKTGVNCSINCGVLIGRNSRVYPNSFVKENLPENSVFDGKEIHVLSE
ncbi:NTP transferase domain-containing protein [Candidatus Micrarchaeota archaeon]|nr:NTP transferase domain-containing protein [Candidatus Micrarchaeota archaeon]